MNALRTPALDDERMSESVCGLSVLSGATFTSWSTDESVIATDRRLVLKLAPHRPAIIGRAEGVAPPYLDPSYTPTTILPGTGETILRYGGEGRDNVVSRGHFMLAAVAGGVRLVNGVPRAGGGLRPPKNGTWLVFPEARQLKPEEDYFIERGSSIVIWLPNGSEIQIDAEM